jgi:hypothetical protein
MGRSSLSRVAVTVISPSVKTSSPESAARAGEKVKASIVAIQTRRSEERRSARGKRRKRGPIVARDKAFEMLMILRLSLRGDRYAVNTQTLIATSMPT